MARGGCRLTTDNSEHRRALRSRASPRPCRGLLGDDRAERSTRPCRGGSAAGRGPGMSAANAFRAATRARLAPSASTRRWRARGELPSPPVEGSLTRMVGLALEASGCQAAVGDVCDLLNGDGSRVRGRSRRLRRRQTVSHAHGRSAWPRAGGARDSAAARRQRARGPGTAGPHHRWHRRSARRARSASQATNASSC